MTRKPWTRRPSRRSCQTRGCPPRRPWWSCWTGWWSTRRWRWSRLPWGCSLLPCRELLTFSRTATWFHLSTSLLKVSPGKCLHFRPRLLIIRNTHHRSQLAQKALLYLALLVSCVGISYLFVTVTSFLFLSTPSSQAGAIALSIIMFLFILGILKLFAILSSIQFGEEWTVDK